MAELEPGEEFAGHRILGVAGRGGMGIVYRALQPDLDRVVALKLIATPLAADPAFRERFIRESRAAAAIDHPSVVPVHYAGEHDGRLYLVMRFVEGEDLRSLVSREGPLDPARAAALALDIGGALDAAHARGLVHRDVKPANVLLDADGRAYLSDFGLTKRAEAETSMTASGRWVGTLGYVSPEQIRGEPVDARADVYALACVLCFALMGVPPYRRESDEATLLAHLHDEPPAVPGPLGPVVARALDKDPGRRPPSAGDLGRAAMAAVAGGPAPAPERMVARGAAAPAGAADDPTRAAGGDTPTHASRKRSPRHTSGRIPARVRSIAGGVGALLAGAGIVLASGALIDSDGSDVAGDPPRTIQVAGQVAKLTRADTRPLDLAYARGRAWSVSLGTGRMVGAGRTGRRTIDLPGGRGTQSVTAGFRSLWTVNSRDRLLSRVDPETGSIQARIALPPGEAVVADAGGGAVWVGIRRNGDPASLESVLRVDPKTGTIVKTIPFPAGVGDLAAGEGALWVINRTADRVTRIDIASGRTANVATGAGPRRIAVGGGYVWVTNQFDDTVTQISPRNLNRVTIGVGRRPFGIAANRRAAWVSSELEGTLTRIDPRTSRIVGEPLRVGRNPGAVVEHDTSAWVALRGDDAVARVDM